MNRTLIQSISLVFLLVSAVSAHAEELPVADAKPPVEVKEKATPAPTGAWSPGLAGSILSSRFATQHSDVSKAAKYLAESLKRDPENEGLKHQAMRAHLVAGEMPRAIEIARKLQVKAGADPLVASIVMIDAVERGALDEASAAISKPSNRGLFGIIRPAMNEWITIAKGGLKSPVTMKAAIEKAGFFAPFLHYHVALMNDVLGFGDIALEHYGKASVEEAATPYRVVEARANAYLRKNDVAQAQNIFAAYAKENPESNLIPDHLPKATKSKVIAPLVSSPKEGLAELFFSTASVLFGEEMANESFIYLRLALALRPDLPPAQLMLANLYETSAEYQQAIAIYESIAPGTVFHKRALIRKALNVEAMGDKNKAIEQLRTVSKEYPKDEASLIAIGDIYREQEQFEDAVSAYSEAIERAGVLTTNDWPLLYARGIAYERADMWNAAERDFLHALKISPAQPDVLNYLGYSWLIQGKHTKKAMGYIENALSARPDDAHIIDSMGWAYYLTGDYTNAVEMLERAVDLMPQDPTVNDHFGDALWKVGRRTEAEYQWKRALSFKPAKDDAERIRNKISLGLSETNDTPRALGKNDALPSAKAVQ